MLWLPLRLEFYQSRSKMNAWLVNIVWFVLHMVGKTKIAFKNILTYRYFHFRLSGVVGISRKLDIGLIVWCENMKEKYIHSAKECLWILMHGIWIALVHEKAVLYVQNSVNNCLRFLMKLSGPQISTITFGKLEQF